ncbi:MAG: WD40-repeat-containing domain protein [Linnemannia gamsii]|nr:MAG: WD40-repeat-containing domain protein [Linnemannia gamsii]
MGSCLSTPGLSQGGGATARPMGPPPIMPTPRSYDLPKGWLCQYDPQSKHLFYINTATGQRQWENPNGPAASANDAAQFREQMNSYEQQLANYNRGGGYQQMQQQQQQQQYYQGGNGMMGGSNGYGRGGGGMGGMAKGGMMGLLAGTLIGNQFGNHNGGGYGGGGYGNNSEYANDNGGSGGGGGFFGGNDGYGGGFSGNGDYDNNLGGGGGTSKAPLGDITHRPLTGRRSGNTTAQQVANLTCSAGQGDENNPARGLLDLFAAQSGSSLNRKRSLKQFTNSNNSNSSNSPIVRFLSPHPTPPTTPNKCSNNNAAANAGTVASASANNIKTAAPVVVVDNSTTYQPSQHSFSAADIRQAEEHSILWREGSHPDSTKQILAHQNAIFDLCWTRDDSKIVSVSGDQSARIHDVETKKCIGMFSGHTGSIKSVSMKHNDDFIFATAARDGAVMIWDSRCSSTTSASGETVYRPADRLLNVHASTTRAAPPKKTKHGSDGPNTASAVQYMLHNENIIASTGSLDGSIKYWDVRKHGTYFKHDYPTPLLTSKYTPTTRRAHGMTSMALSPDGSALYALSSDNNIYMYNTTALGHPVERFGGSNFACSSYYIKISVSPDGNYIASGSSKDLYVWETNRPQKKPLIFQGHEREVTGVDWAKDLGHGTELSGCSDDAKVRTWKPNGELVQECRENKSLQNLHGIVSE